MVKTKPANANNEPNYPTFYRKSIASGHPGIPKNPNTELPDKSLIAAMFLDVPYASQSDAQKIDLYIPKSGRAPYPIYLWIHGGGWSLMDKRIYIKEFADVMLKRGCAVAALNFRPTNEAIFPAQIFDAKAAVRFIRANARKYNVSSDKIIAIGGSSGGHMVSMLGTSGGVKELEDLSMGNPDVSSRVNAVVNMSGPIDFLQLDPKIKELGHKPPFFHDTETSAESGLVGGLISKYPDRCRAANPTTYIKADNPPFYLQYAKNDEMIPYFQGINFANALKAVIGEDKLMLYLSETAGHGNPAGLPEDLDTVSKFLMKHLP